MDIGNAIAELLFVGIVIWFFFLRRFGNGAKKFDKRKAGQYDTSYKTKRIKMPAIRGWLVSLLNKIQNSMFGQVVVSDLMNHTGMFDYFRAVEFEELPTFYPVVSCDDKMDLKQCSSNEIEHMLMERPEKDDFDFHFTTVYSYVSRYRNGDLTPSEVAERALKALDEVKQINAIKKHDANRVRKMAEDSTQRYKDKQTLSPVDGVLVIIKDEYHVEGFECNSGTSFLNEGCGTARESNVVRKLRDLGVIVFAVANMHELGLGTSGNNTNKNFGTCRNPYNLDHYPGGSSSGSASAVAAGMACMGLGTDGGGSIRIPASYCGVVGLKPTFARITLGQMVCHSMTVGHSGPICTNVRDAAAFFALMAGPDPAYRPGMTQAPVQLPTFKKDLTGLRIGIDHRFCEDCLYDVRELFERAVAHLEGSGATMISLEIPDIFEANIAHRTAILSEMATSALDHFDNHFNDLTLQSRTLFRMGQNIKAIDYIQANRQRTRSMAIFKELFEKVDVIVTPTAAHCAPAIVESELTYGFVNANQDTMNMRFIALGNLTGVPAVTVPVGYNALGLPCGFQAMSSWYREDLALQVAEYVERRTELRRPSVYVDLLQS